MIRWRVIIICIAFFLFGAGIVTQLFFLQIKKGDLYKAFARGLRGFNIEISQDRGKIIFDKQEPLAINMEWPLIFASFQEVGSKNDGEKTAESLSGILSLDKDLILELMAQDNFYSVIKKRLSDEEVQKIKEVNLKGIHLGVEEGRYYPQENFASQLVGFLDQDSKGRYGLEEYYDDALGNGEDVNLTIDYSIQFTAEKLLKEAKESLNIESGSIVIMEPLSGKILAMANFPNFNSNQYSEVADFDIFQNPATQKLFEPGSIFKPLTMASAIEEGKVTPQTTYVDPGVIKIGGYKILNYDERIWGEKTMTEVLEKSINTGAVFAEQTLQKDVFLGYLSRFGIFEPTGVDLQEIYSENKELKKGYDINFATASFGQGVEMTPLQILRAYTAVANEGRIAKPYLKKGSKEDFKEVISSKTASQVTTMLVSVVENGYAKSAKIPGYYVAGKTGTAQVSYSSMGIKKAGYSEKTIQTFVGFAPAFEPRFLVLVKLDNPASKTAEYSAVPVFKKLAKYIIDYYQIPPDFEE